MTIHRKRLAAVLCIGGAILIAVYAWPGQSKPTPEQCVEELVAGVHDRYRHQGIIERWLVKLRLRRPRWHVYPERYVAVLRQHPEQAVSLLADLVRQEGADEEDYHVRGVASGTLGRLGPEATPALIARLGDDHWRVRAVVAEALGQIGPAAEDAVPALIAALRPQLAPTGAISRALAKIGPAAIPALIVAMKHDDPQVRRYAADALSWMGPEAKDAVPALVVALKDPDEQTRYTSAYALGKIGPAAKDAVPALTEALKDEYEPVRRHAAEALDEITPAETTHGGEPSDVPPSGSGL